MPRATLTANQLRRLAEAADNCGNGVDHVLIANDSAGTYDVVTSAAATAAIAAAPGTIEVLLPINTPVLHDPMKTRQHLSTIVVGNGTTNLTLPDDFDAMFWSEASMSKFLLLYYGRMLTAPELTDLRRVIGDENVVAILHVCPSIYTALDINLTFHVVFGTGASAPGSMPLLQRLSYGQYLNRLNNL